MLYLIKNREDLEKSDDLNSSESQIKALRLHENLAERHLFFAETLVNLLKTTSSNGMLQMLTECLISSLFCS